jgi:HAMP domain-containing protein
LASFFACRSFSSVLDVSQGVDRATIATGAVFGGFRPGVWRLKIAIPERPGSTLNWSRLVDHAITFLWVEKDTIAIGILNQAFACSDLSHKSPAKGLQIIAKVHRSGHLFDVAIVDPNETGAWSTATITALGTLKSEAIGIPRQRHGKLTEERWGYQVEE